MIILNNLDLIHNISAPMVSKEFANLGGDILALQISGATGRYCIEGKSANSDWYPLGGINLSDFTVATGAFTKPGLYEIGVASVRRIRARVETTDGEVSITAQLISSSES